MKTILIALALATVAALGACGDDDDGGGPAATVELSGDTLVDSKGAALYVSDQEADGRVRCVDACAEVWLPLTARRPTAGPDVPGRLGVVKRPGGARQVTYDGKPVYRFAEDGAGEVTGDGLSDSFDGRKFTWRALGNAQSEPPSDYSY